MRLGILTGGGDCPGLNAVIRAVVRTSLTHYGSEVVGIRDGWKGLLEPRFMKLDLNAVSRILTRGGTILGTSRTNPLRLERGLERIRENMEAHGLEAVIAVGGEDTLGTALRLSEVGGRVVGVPKTIDNDVQGTDYTFGFNTAVEIATEAIDRLYTTAESHNRVVVVELMGRHAGWIATEAGIAGGADVILVPELPVSLERVCEILRKRHREGRDFSLIVVAEGASFAPGELEEAQPIRQDVRPDEYGHVRLGGVGQVLADAIEKRTGFEARVSVLGYIVRGGTPTAFDRVLGTRFGVAAAELVHQGTFGRMVALRGNRIVNVALSEAVAEIRTVDPELYRIAQLLFG